MSPAPRAVHHAHVAVPAGDDLHPAAQALLGGRAPGPALTVAPAFGAGLAEHLDAQASPNLVLLVAHGHPAHRQFIRVRDPAGANDQLIPVAWWDHGHGHVSVLAFACWGAQCHAGYPLAGRVRRFLGFSIRVGFHLLPDGRPSDLVRAFLDEVGRLFFAAAEVDEALHDRILDAYDETIRRLDARGDQARNADAVSAILLRRQRKALTLLP